MKSKRFEVLAQRPVNQDGFVKEWPEVGMIAMNGPNDPKPSIRIENGKVVELDGKRRSADIGLLYDPRRPGEAALCERWKAALGARLPALNIRRNYPYAGKGDGLTAWLRQRLSPECYVGVELEVNQQHILGTGSHWPALREAIVTALRDALAGNPPASPR